MEATLHIAGRNIGAGHPCFVIAEAGVNHNGDLSLALRLADAALQARADAVKFQTFSAKNVVTRAATKAAYQMETTGSSESQFEMLKKLELPLEDFRTLKSHCEKIGILFLSTAFDAASADFLNKIGMAAFKIPSGEVTNIPFLEHIARKKKPIIFSTGMSTLDEVRVAVEAIRSAGNSELALLHCVSNYPAQSDSANLRAMNTLRTEFGCPVGFSDHTMGSDIALAAVALGANIIEKHLTLDRNMAGPDHTASIDPNEFAAMVRAIRNVESALGDGVKRPVDEEQDVATVARRSLVAAREIPMGSVLGEEDIEVLRPGTGLPPAMLMKLIGRRTARNISAGALLRLDMLQ